MDELTIEIERRKWRIRRPSNLEEMWNALGDEDFGEDERLPYWVEVWPASVVLAGWLVEHQKFIRSMRCLDIGCGLGFTSLVAASLGAQVIGMDYEPEALLYARQNALVNNVVSNLLWVAADWRQPAFLSGSFPVIWAGDIVYEQRFIEPVASFISHCLHPEGRMWIAEPSRGVYKEFISHSKKEGLNSSRVRSVAITAPEGHQVSVNIWEIRKA